MGAHLILKNTKCPGSTRPISVRQMSLKNSSLSAALDLFRLCERRPTSRQTVASLTLTPRGRTGTLPSESGYSPRPLLEVFQKEPSRLLVQLRSLAGNLPRLQGAVLIEPYAVTLESVAR